MKRFGINYGGAVGTPILTPNSLGEWVRIKDYEVLAAQNRRRGEALEKLKKWAGKIGYPDWVKLCEEALKC